MRGPQLRRVLLRPPTLRDQEEFLRATRGSRTLHRGLVRPPDSPEAYRVWLKRVRRENCEGRLVIDAQNDSIVGVANLNEIVRGGFQSAYLGYYAFEPFHGQGFMRAGVASLVRAAFRELGLHRIEANIQPHNTPSVGVVKALGFRLEGFSPRYLKAGGRWRDHERWALTREDWTSARGTKRRR